VSQIAYPDDGARAGSTPAPAAAASSHAPSADEGRERTLPPDLAAARQRRLAQHLALVTAAHAIGVWEIDVDTGAMHWNMQMLSLYGIESSGTPRHPAAWLERHVLPEDRERVLRAARPTQPATDGDWPGASTRRIEHRIVRGDGQVRWIESQSALVQDEDGRHLMLGTSRDITERKESEQQLRDALQRLQWATDWAHVGVFLRDPATGGGYWNRQLFDLFGLTPDPLQPTRPPPFEHVAERVHPDDQARYQAYWSAIRDLSAVAIPDQPLRVLLPDGALRWLTVRAQRIDGRVDAPVAGVAIDITERMQSEQRAEEIARRLQVASEAGRIGLSERDLVTGAGFWNATLLEFNGLPPDAPTPSRDELLRGCHPDDRPVLTKAWRELSEGSGVAEYEVRAVRPDGTVRWLRSRARVERDSAGRPVRVVGAAVDVTEERAAAQRLSDALQRLKLAAEAGNIGIWERDLRDGSAVWDATQFKLMDFPPPNAPTREQTLARVHPDDHARVRAWWQRMIDGHEPQEVESRVLRSDGTLMHVATRGIAVRDAAGSALRIVGTTIDVTAQRRSEQERDLLFERLQLAMKTARMGVWERREQERHETWDAQMRAIYGIDDPAWQPSRAAWLARVHPADRPGVEQQVAQLERNGGGALAYRIVRDDGEVRYIDDHLRIDRDDRGRITRLLGVHVDATDVRQTQLERDELMRRLQLATAAVGFGAYEWQPALNRSEWNDQMYALLGHTRESFRDHVWLDAVHPADRPLAQARMAEALAYADTFALEYRTLWPDGTVRWLATRGQVQRAASGQAERIIGLHWDITESRVADSALRAKELAERASAAKSEFLSRMSHELRTPLNAILGFTQLLELDQSQPLATTQAERVAHIRTAGWHLLTLINEVLDLSRIESGADRIEREAVAVAPLVDRCVSMMQNEAARRRIALDVLPIAASVQALADPVRLKQVLLNLLSNAIKYNRDDGRVTLSATADGAHVRLAVRDTGRGLSAEQLDKLYQPFNRLGLESAAIEGTGIGLVISLKLTERMGGRLDVWSEPGVGSEFSVTLPRALGEAAPGSALAVAAAAEAARGTVLYAEDQPASRAQVAALLAQRPAVRLVSAATGATAGTLALQLRPDLILIDLNLPDMAGADLLRLLRAQPVTTGIRCLALAATPADRSAALAHGFDDCLLKPLDRDDFLRRIDAALVPP
jgi:hypothetical protein